MLTRPQKMHHLRLEILIWMHVLVLWLLLFRLCIFHESSLWFLWWNIFLAWVAVGFAWLASHQTQYWRIISLVGWLLFFPNTIYIITDLIHLVLRYTAPIASTYTDSMLLLSQNTLMITDIVLLFCAGCIGVYLAYISLVLLMPLTQTYTRMRHCLLSIGLACVTSFAILLGRIERWNSWDLLISPLQCVEAFFHTLSSTYVLKTIVLYCLIFGPISLFVYRIAYLTSKRRV